MIGNLLLIALAAFLLHWAIVVTFNRPFIEDKRQLAMSWVVTSVLFVTSLGLIAYVA